MRAYANVDHELYIKAAEDMSYIKNSPCNNCVVLAMCLNKDLREIINCPLLNDAFNREATKLSYPGSKLVRVKPLRVEFWITRNTATSATVDLIEGGMLLMFTSKIIELEEDTS